MHASRETHAIFFRLGPGDALPDALFAKLREAGVATGTLRAHGVLEHVELRTFSSQTRTLGASRALAGALHAIAIEGTIGLSEGTPQAVLRALLSRETDAGVDTLSGVVQSARVVALEVVVTSAQDLALPLAHEPRAGLAMLGDTAGPAPSPNRPPTPNPNPSPNLSPPPNPSAAPNPQPSAWAEAIATSAAQKPLPARPPTRAAAPEEADQILPEAGDLVQHFAFGPCEVLRSDGDRLHLKVGKDGRIREIALEMLKVTQLDEDPNTRPRHFKLDRRL
ncbi:MAG TPA: DUF296 domain-containing protein [Polyangiaceae bacterium]